MTQDPALVESLPSQPRGRPLLLTDEIDAEVLHYVQAVRLAGGIVNRKIVVASALGITKALRPLLLKEHSGYIDLVRNGRSWSDSLLRRAVVVKQTGTKAARKLPADFPLQKSNFLERISDVVGRHCIPGELIVNLDETGLKIVPVSSYTLADVGSKQVPIIGLEDKREITALLACSLHGNLLPPQLIYQGKSDRCHPPVDFPRGWDIFNSENHRSTSFTLQRFVDNVLGPWRMKWIEELGLQIDQKCLLVMDWFLVCTALQISVRRLNRQVLRWSLCPLDARQSCNH